MTPIGGNQGIKMTYTARILLVEDFEPLLRYEASLLQENPEWRIIGEATDGLEAI
jgi:hypothetical protein